MEDKTAITIEAYNKNYHSYNEKFMNYSSYVGHVNEFANLLEDGFSVLDIGCGPGNVAKQLCIAKTLEITGIDLSSEMVEVAKENVPQGNFYLQDSRQADFPLECFDAVVLSFSIVHLYDHEAFELLAKAAKWLQSGGYLYISFMEGREAGFETTCFSTAPIYFNYFKRNEIQDILTENGIQCIRTVEQDYLEPDGSNTADIFIFGKKQ